MVRNKGRVLGHGKRTERSCWKDLQFARDLKEGPAELWLVEGLAGAARESGFFLGRKCKAGTGPAPSPPKSSEAVWPDLVFLPGRWTLGMVCRSFYSGAESVTAPRVTTGASGIVSTRARMVAT